MSGWKEIELGSALKVRHGFAFKGEYFTDSGDLIVLTPGNFIDAGGFKPKGGKEKYYEGGPVPDGYLLSKGDVVIAMTEQAHGLLGSSATIPVDGTYLHNQRIGLVELVAPDVLDLRFAYHAMNSPLVRHQLQATATGTKVRHTAPERIHSVRAAVPCLDEQKQIARILDSLDELLGNNRRRMEVLEEMAGAIYREWFVHFRFPGHEDAIFVDSDLGPIPEGWAAGTLRDLVDEIRDSVKPSNRTAALPYVPIDVIDPKSLTLRRAKPGSEAASSLRLFEEGDVLFGAMRAYFHKVCIAPFEGVTRSTCLVLRPQPERRGFAEMTLATEGTVAYAAAHSSGSTIPYAKWKGVLAQMPVVLPSASLCADFRLHVDPLLRNARLLAASDEPLQGVRDLLLPKLMTGQIDVSDLDLDAIVEKADV